MRFSASTVLREDWLAAVRAGLGRYAAFELASPAPRLPGTPAELRGLRRLGQRHGLAYSVHAPFRDLDPAAADGALRRRSEELYLGALETGAGLGAELVVMHPATVSLAEWETLGEPARRAVRRREIDAFGRMASRAARLGVRIGVENMPGFRAARDASWIERIVREVGSPWLGFTVDVGHAHTAGIPPALLLRHLGPRLWHVHVHDNSGQGDQHRALGEGSVDWVSVAGALVELDYRGLVVDESLDLAAQLRGGARLRQLVARARLVRGLPRSAPAG
jgi:sugar phosphate isomerase/epimerase